MNEELIPVLVGVGQLVERDSSANGSTPVEMMAEAAKLAVEDCGAKNLLSNIHCLAAVGLTVDAAQVKSPVSGMYKNVPKTVANLLGAKPARLIYTETGGNTPQRLVNYFAGQIADGEVGAVLITGGEALNTMAKRFSHWTKLLLPKGGWRDKPGGRPEIFGDSRPGNSKLEGRYGMTLPTRVYPLFENALCAHYQRTPQEHLEQIGGLFARFAKVAANNPHAWFQQRQTADELITPSAANRMIASPYTKRLNSMISVNQSAAVVMTSLAKAKALGISQNKYVFLHGAGDADDIWHVSERENFHSSPAMRSAAESALAMSGKSIDDMAFFDLYSCFPSAVQIACDEFGIAHNDSRGLTLTGGLPYFGGPGNNYSMHGIVEMVHRARSQPDEFGLLNANGWYLTKHSVGVYSAVPPNSPWRQTEKITIDQGMVNCIEQAQGEATIETYTVVFDKNNQPKRAIIIARLKSGERFISDTDGTPSSYAKLLDQQCIDQPGQVSYVNGKNVLTF